MSDWAVALSAMGALAGVGFLVHAIISAILARVDKVGADLKGDVDKVGADLTREMDLRFSAAEERRQEATAAAAERMAERDRRIDVLRADLSALQAVLPDRYVQTAAYFEAEGRTMITLEKIKEALARLEARPHG